MLTFFAEKMWVAFAVFSAKNIRILCIESAKTVNEMTLNELVKLTTCWTTGPWYFTFSTKNIDCGYLLELPQWGSSDEYPQSMFLAKYKKNVYPCKTPVLLYKSGVKRGQNYMYMYIDVFSWWGNSVGSQGSKALSDRQQRL